MRALLVPGIGLLVAAAAFGTAAGQEQPRQRYGPWQYNQVKNYYFRKYEYKVQPQQQEYQHDYVIYFKEDPKINNKWVYFYNPKTEKYWARYPTTNNDQYKKYAEKRQEAWSELPAQ